MIACQTQFSRSQVPSMAYRSQEYTSTRATLFLSPCLYSLTHFSRPYSLNYNAKFRSPRTESRFSLPTVPKFYMYAHIFSLWTIFEKIRGLKSPWVRGKPINIWRCHLQFQRRRTLQTSLQGTLFWIRKWSSICTNFYALVKGQHLYFHNFAQFCHIFFFFFFFYFLEYCWADSRQHLFSITYFFL